MVRVVVLNHLDTGPGTLDEMRASTGPRLACCATRSPWAVAIEFVSRRRASQEEGLFWGEGHNMGRVITIRMSCYCSREKQGVQEV